MKRKLARTNIDGGSRSIGCNHGQWQTTFYCPQCRRHGDHPHDPGCTGAFVRISTTVQIPRRSAPPRAWRLFNERFVYRRAEIVAAAIERERRKRMTPRELYRWSAWRKECGARP